MRILDIDSKRIGGSLVAGAVAPGHHRQAQTVGASCLFATKGHPRIMEAKARILIVSSDSGRSDQWSGIVQHLGYDSVRVDPCAALAQARLCRADCALVETGFGPAVLDALLDGRAGAPGVPLVLLEPDLADIAPPQDTDDSTPREAALVRHIRRRLDAMVRIKTMADEWRRRHRVYTALGNEPTWPDNPAALAAERTATLLVAGMPSTDYPVIESAFASDRISIVAAFTPLITVDYLSRHSFDVVILTVGDDVAPFLPAISALRRNHRLADAPVVVVAPPAGLSDPQAALRAGVTDILTRPLNETPAYHGGQDWIDRIRSFLIESVTRKALTQCLRALPPESFCDAVTGLAGRATFECWLAQMLSDQRTDPRPWSLAIFDLSETERADGTRLRTGNTVFCEAASMIRALTRVEDFTARVGPSEIALALPATPPDAGAQVAERVAATLSATSFEGVGGEPLRLVPRVTPLVARAGESARLLLGRALAQARGTVV